MMPHEQTPQDKKRKSLERDCRNCYGENDKSSRKAIHRRKAIVNRTFRRATKQSLSAPEADADDLDVQVTRIQRIHWKKAPDKPLGEHLLDKLVSQILTRLADTPDADHLLEIIETHLTDTGTPRQEVQDIMPPLRRVVRVGWSLSRSIPLKLNLRTARTIRDILNHHRA